MASIINASTSGAGGLIQTADSSGVLALQAAGTTIASVSGTGVAVTGTVADSVGTLRPLVSGTAVASTSGTSVDFTGIPSWVKRITVIFSGVSTNGTSLVQLQLGAGSIITTGYIGSGGLYPAASGANSTTGMLTEGFGSASANRVGSMIVHNITGNTWVGSGVFGSNHVAVVTQGASSIALSGALDRVRITTVNGTDTFDAGSINIMYE